MHNYGQARPFAVAFLALLAAACGGDGGGGGSSPAAARGTIQRFGSIVVNGVEWKTVGAKLKLDDNGTDIITLATETEIQDHLRRGQEVEVRGRLDDSGRTGTATEIRFGEDFKGLVTATDGTSFTVLGIIVVVDASTVITDDLGAVQPFSAITANVSWVEVSGTPDVGGAFRATHVKIEDVPGAADEVKGFVFDDPSDGQFGLSMTPSGTPFLTVTWTPEAGIGVGDFVEVHGTFSAGTLAATLVELEDRFGDDGLKTQIEGIVISGTLAEFQIGDTTVQTSASTVYRNIPVGSTAEQEFVLGVKLEAEGVMSGGVLIASKVKFKDGSRLGGAFATLSANSLSVLGLTVVFDETVKTQGDAGTSNFVEVRGYRRANGEIFAQRLTYEESSDRPFLEGVVEAETASSLTIADITATTDAGTEFQDGNETLITSTAFFALVNPGQTVVKVKWDTGAAITDPLRSAEIELEDD
jgi:hypothetical protein